MYAVIKTGGKQYRVSPGDVLVVEKLEGEPGAVVAFGDVLMLGDGEAVTVGAPLVDGASVAATLVETRKGEKVKIFKKIRRQGYRRTGGHRQAETVLRVTGITAGGSETKWDGEVSLTTKAELDARARGLDFATLNVSKKTLKAAAAAETVAKAKAPKVVDTAPAEAAPAPEPEAKATAPKKAAAPKAAKADAPESKPAATKAAAPKKTAAKKDDAAE
ncbi:50S ribosomal protein L21 [Phenylobacterium sp.]|uniref:50S ribosomal protein L21 n=1 Tax=Phenylobacterium sp. TaxID=1871053 RepID=UPI0025D11C41|nr:50S ribosomal protein L21 [Phenylobacterium sp.]